MVHKRVTESFQIYKEATVKNTNQYLEKTKIEGFGGNLVLYSCLEKESTVSRDMWYYRAKIVRMTNIKIFFAQ